MIFYFSCSKRLKIRKNFNGIDQKKPKKFPKMGNYFEIFIYLAVAQNKK